jgi:predicted negative regulator of RcsB-dependent stress response
VKDRYRAAFTQQGGLLAARAAEKGQYDARKRASPGSQRRRSRVPRHRRLRLAGLLLDTAKYDEGLKQLDAISHSSPRSPLIAVRRCCSRKAERAEARSYQKAWSAMDPRPTTGAWSRPS